MLPFFQTNAKSMLKNAAKTGMEVADDVIEGRSFVDSVKKRVPAGIKRGVEDIVFQSVPAKRQRQRGPVKDSNDVDDVTSSRNGVRSRSVL